VSSSTLVPNVHEISDVSQVILQDCELHSAASLLFGKEDGI